MRVRDFAAASRWYARLLGEPSMHPHATETVWTLDEGRSVYIVERAHGAGGASVTVIVDDLDARIAAIAARGLQPREDEILASGARKVAYRDPDGNEIAFGAVPCG